MKLCESCERPSLRLRRGYVTKCTVNEKGLHHSYDNQSAVEWENGEKNWYQDGKYHREDGPALIGTVWNEWFLEGKRIWNIIDSQEVIIRNPIEIQGVPGIVLRHVVGCFYEVLLGNKKMLIAVY